MDVKGKTIVLTGKFGELSRKEAQTRLEELGARCTGSVSSKTDLVFAGEKAGSKVSQATRLGIPVFGESELMVVLFGAPEPVEPERFEIPSWDATPDETTRARIASLRKAGRAIVTSNSPHENQLTAWGIAPDGRHLATGTWCGDDYYRDGGQIAVWEIATGRCVNVIRNIVGGVGWPGHKGCIQWSPDGLRIGVAFDTNGVGYVDAFTPTDRGIIEVSYVTDGWDEPAGWCWAPDSSRVFISCWGYQQSPLAGVITAPSSHSPAPVYMAESDDPQLPPMRSIVWRDDQKIVGATRGDVAYGIDATTRTLAWRAEISAPHALSPDGRFLAFGSGFLRVIDTGTGEVEDWQHPGGSELLWAPDGRRLAVFGGRVRVLRGSEVEAVIPRQLKVGAYWGTPDLLAASWSPDSSMLAFCTGDRVEVWSVSSDPELLYAVDCEPDTGVFLGHGGHLVLATSDRLSFFDHRGERLVSHALLAVPHEDPVTDELALPGFNAFVVDEQWGYAADDLIVSPADPQNAVQLSIDGQAAVPITWADVPIYPSFEAVAAASPKMLPAAVRKHFAGSPPTTPEKPGSRLPFPLENEATIEDVVAFAITVLDGAERRYDIGQYYVEIALHFLREGRVDDAMELTEHFGDDSYNARPLGLMATYLACGGHTEQARGLLGRAQIGLDTLVNDATWWTKAAAWTGATRSLLDGDDHELERALKRSDDVQDLNPRMEVATAHACLGRFDEALEIIRRGPPGGLWWHALAHMTRLFRNANDLSRYLDYVELLAEKEWANHFELLFTTVDTCLEVDDVDKAMSSLRFFDGLSTTPSRERILYHAFEHRGLDVGIGFAMPLIERARAEAWIGEEAQLWAVIARFDAQVVQDELHELLERAVSSSLDRWSATRLFKGLAVILPRTEPDLIPDLFDSVACGEAWCTLLSELPREDRYFDTALQKALDCTPGWDGLLRATHRYPDVYERVVQAAADAVGTDRHDLAQLVATTAELGDLTTANRLRMTVRKSSRANLSASLARGAAKLGHWSAFKAMIEELDVGFGSHGREYEALRGLLRNEWCGARVAHIM